VTLDLFLVLMLACMFFGAIFYLAYKSKQQMPRENVSEESRQIKKTNNFPKGGKNASGISPNSRIVASKHFSEPEGHNHKSPDRTPGAG
jgi:hypothetical protein